MLKGQAGRPATITAMLAALMLAPMSPVNAAAAEPDPGALNYGIVADVPAPEADGVWDYAAIDPLRHRLYLAQGGVTVLDLHSGHVTAGFVRGSEFRGVVPVHSALPLPDTSAVAVSDSQTHSVLFVDSASGSTIAKVRVRASPQRSGWHDPDALAYDPATGLLVAVDGDSGVLALIDTHIHSVRRTIRLKGKLEFVAASGTGMLFVNEESRNAIAFVNAVSGRVIRHVGLKACEEPTGIAFDAADQLVISVCSNGVVKFVSAVDGSEAASVKVGAGADGVIYDAKRHLVFSTGGEEGTLSVISVRGPGKISLAQTIRTGIGARLAALDPDTGRLYIPSATMGPPAPPLKLPGLDEMPGINSGTFHFLVVGPISP